MTQLLHIDRADFDANYGTTPYAVRHELADHPLLTPERLAVLADALPATNVEHNLGSVPAVLPGGEASRVDASPGEVARTIETNGSWMVLKYIEADPEYAALLNTTLDEVVPLVAAREGRMRQREGFIFLSAPDSTTPAHLDPEHNFLLQIRGTKNMVVGQFPDADSEQRELERFYGGGHRNVEWMFEQPRDFPLNPGDGVYVPFNAPHLVRNGPTLSVSLSITWRTPQTLVVTRAHIANARLRALGLSPAPPGKHALVDNVKALAARSAQRVGRELRARRA
jgi:Cupin superfamily protein